MEGGATEDGDGRGVVVVVRSTEYSAVGARKIVIVGGWVGGGGSITALLYQGLVPFGTPGTVGSSATNWMPSMPKKGTAHDSRTNKGTPHSIPNKSARAP